MNLRDAIISEPVSQRCINATPGYLVGGLGATENITPVSSKLRKRMTLVTEKTADSQETSEAINDYE